MKGVKKTVDRTLEHIICHGSNAQKRARFFNLRDEKSLSCFRMASALGSGFKMALRTRFNNHAMA
jgi:hypothetical protein